MMENSPTLENSAGTMEATDVAPYNGMLAPWEVRMTQLSNGGFHGRLDFARIGETVIYRERWSRRMLVDTARARRSASL